MNIPCVVIVAVSIISTTSASLAGGQRGLSQSEITQLDGLRESALDIAVARNIFCGRAMMDRPTTMTKQIVAGVKYEWISKVYVLPERSGYFQQNSQCFETGWYKFILTDIYLGNSFANRHLRVEPAYQ